MKKLLLFAILAIFYSCSDNKQSLPSGSPKDVLSKELYKQLSKKYKVINDFEFGYSIVKKDRFGVIDYKGQEVLPCEYDSISKINNDSKMLLKNEKYGIAEYNGNIVIDVTFDDILYKQDCDTSYVIALKKGKMWGMVDPKGKTILPYEYDDIPDIDYNCAVIGKNNKYGIVDSIGNPTVELKYDTIYYHHEESDISLAQLNQNIGIINSHNKIVTDCIYNCEFMTFKSMPDVIPQINPPRNGYIRLEKYQASGSKPKLFGLVECETGKEVIPFVYDDLGDYNEGLIWAEKDRKFGYINIENKVIIPFEYDKAYNFSEGLAAVGKQDGYYHAVMGTVPNIKIGFINKQGNVEIPFKFQPQLVLDLEFSEGLVAIGVSSDNLWGLNIGYINREGEFVISAKYDDAEAFRNGLGKVRNDNNLYGYVNRTGEEIIPLEFDYTCFENDTLISCNNYKKEIKVYYSVHNGKVKKLENYKK